MSKLTRDEARGHLASVGAEIPGDYHALRSDQVGRLLTIARGRRYTKPRSYPGSTGRAFHAFLQRTATAKPE